MSAPRSEVIGWHEFQTVSAPDPQYEGVLWGPVWPSEFRVSAADEGWSNWTPTREVVHLGDGTFMYDDYFTTGTPLGDTLSQQTMYHDGWKWVPSLAGKVGLNEFGSNVQARASAGFSRANFTALTTPPPETNFGTGTSLSGDYAGAAFSDTLGGAGGSAAWYGASCRWTNCLGRVQYPSMEGAVYGWEDAVSDAYYDFRREGGGSFAPNVGPYGEPIDDDRIDYWTVVERYLHDKVYWGWGYDHVVFTTHNSGSSSYIRLKWGICEVATMSSMADSDWALRLIENSNFPSILETANNPGVHPSTNALIPHYSHPSHPDAEWWGLRPAGNQLTYNNFLYVDMTQEELRDSFEPDFVNYGATWSSFVSAGDVNFYSHMPTRFPLVQFGWYPVYKTTVGPPPPPPGSGGGGWGAAGASAAPTSRVVAYEQDR